MEQRERSWPRNSVTIAANVSIAQRKIRWIIGIAPIFCASQGHQLLRREKIDAIQRGDNFTAHEQFLQIVAVTELFVAKDAQPKICVDTLVFVGLDQGRRNEHGDFLSTARATSAAASLSALGNPQSEISSGVADRTRTRNSQNHNLELYH